MFGEHTPDRGANLGRTVHNNSAGPCGFLLEFFDSRGAVEHGYLCSSRTERCQVSEGDRLVVDGR